MPQASLYAVLAGICLLYVSFIWLQGSYYLDALKGVLPAEFTYLEYARNGFFELVKVSMLNICVIAVSKLALYIRAYGLTPLRVIPSVFMVFTFALDCWSF